MILGPIDFALETLAAGFPVGFQPGVTHTKLTVTVSFVNYSAASGVFISFEDDWGNVSGNISLAGLSDANPHTYVFTLVPTGRTFSDGWWLDFGTYTIGTSIGAVVSGLEFS